MKPIRYMGDGPGEGIGNVQWFLAADIPPAATHVPCKGQGLDAKDHPALVAAGILRPGGFIYLTAANVNDFYTSSFASKPAAPRFMCVGQDTLVSCYDQSGTGNTPWSSLTEGKQNLLNGGLGGVGSGAAVTGVSFANDLFFVGTDAGTTVYSVTLAQWLISKGISWNGTATHYTSLSMIKVVYGNGVYLGRTSGGIYTSTGPTFNSADWTARTIGSSSGAFVDIFWDGTQFVAVFAASVHTSPDGATWTAKTLTGLSGFGNITSACYDGMGGYMICSGAKIASSTDLAAWTQLTAPASLPTVTQLTVTGCRGGVLLSCSSTTSTAGAKLLITSDLGVTWTDMFTDVLNGSFFYNTGIQDIATDGGYLCCAGGRGTDSSALYTWYRLGMTVPRLHPLNVEGTLYYPYYKVA